MNCCIAELTRKDVINAKTGCRLGCVSDVEVDVCDGKLTAIIIWGRGKCFGLFGHQDDIRVPWNEIQVIGEDTIIVCMEKSAEPPPRPKPKIFEGLFR